MKGKEVGKALSTELIKTRFFVCCFPTRRKLLLRFSESFLAPPLENSMELVVKVIDLRYTENNEILKRSETLEGYSRLLYYIRFSHLFWITVKKVFRKKKFRKS